MLDGSGARHDRSGFPAHAGMDPACRAEVVKAGAVRGFPAHAGMDRPPSGPHVLRKGFPAHAGMDPPPELLGLSTSSGLMSPYRWFPRPRGDGPHVAMNPKRIIGQGFPAHAGMDPSNYSAYSAGPDSRFPRPRGDGPDHTASWPRGTLRFPRPRGDGPSVYGRTHHPPRYQEVSPPTRGWTCTIAMIFPAQMDDYRFVFGFPAHAGMDPTSPFTVAPVPMRQVSPPTRGWTADQTPKAAPEIPLVSPPTRGWTSTSAIASGSYRLVSPPTRGWTPRAAGVRR